MSIIELGNGSVLKDGVVFDEDARKYCTEINKDENGKTLEPIEEVTIDVTMSILGPL